MTYMVTMFDAASKDADDTNHCSCFSLQGEKRNDARHWFATNWRQPTVGSLYSYIADDSPFRETALQEGYEVLSINNDTHLINDAKHAASMLSGVEGNVSVLACSCKFPRSTKLVLSATVDPGNDTGIRLSSIRACLVRIDSIADTSPFAGSNLQVGDVILSVNNTVVSDVLVAMSLLKYPDHHFHVTVFFLSMKEFRKQALKSLNQRIKVCEWQDEDTCILQLAGWKHSVKLHFERNWSCHVPDAWTYQNDPVRREAMFDSKWYRQTVACAKQLNRYINEQLAGYKAAVTSSNDCIPEAVPVVELFPAQGHLR